MRLVNDKRSLASADSLKGAKRLLFLQALLASICIWMGTLLYAAGPEDAIAARGIMAVSLVPVLALVVSPTLIRHGLKAFLIASALMLLALTAIPGWLLQGHLFAVTALSCAGIGLRLSGNASVSGWRSESGPRQP